MKDDQSHPREKFQEESERPDARDQLARETKRRATVVHPFVDLGHFFLVRRMLLGDFFLQLHEMIVRWFVFVVREVLVETQLPPMGRHEVLIEVVGQWPQSTSATAWNQRNGEHHGNNTGDQRFLQEENDRIACNDGHDGRDGEGKEDGKAKNIERPEAHRFENDHGQRRTTGDEKGDDGSGVLLQAEIDH